MSEHIHPLDVDTPSLKLAHVSSEDILRADILARNHINDLGILQSTNTEGTQQMTVAAVQIDAKHHAHHLPFADTPEGYGFYPCGTNSLRIGLFIGHTTTKEVNAVVRLGAYPGEPLITTVQGIQHQEVMLGLHGIKDHEPDELLWAEQIGLFSGLGFDPTRSRGLFTTARQRNRSNGRWIQAPLTLTMRADNAKTSSHTFQILGYETEEFTPTVEMPTLSPHVRRTKLGAIVVKSLEAAFEITALTS